jgi:hypothetical protein
VLANACIDRFIPALVLTAGRHILQSVRFIMQIDQGVRNIGPRRGNPFARFTD